jgi:type IV pilus assembly protein PilV
LIAVLVAATGVLGASALQLNAVKFNQIANVRSTAVFLAQDITDRMRANRTLALRLPVDGGAARNGRVITVTVRWDESRMSQFRLVVAASNYCLRILRRLRVRSNAQCRRRYYVTAV